MLLIYYGNDRFKKRRKKKSEWIGVRFCQCLKREKGRKAWKKKVEGRRRQRRLAVQVYEGILLVTWEDAASRSVVFLARIRPPTYGQCGAVGGAAWFVEPVSLRDGCTLR